MDGNATISLLWNIYIFCETDWQMLIQRQLFSVEPGLQVRAEEKQIKCKAIRVGLNVEDRCESI